MPIYTGGEEWGIPLELKKKEEIFKINLLISLLHTIRRYSRTTKPLFRKKKLNFAEHGKNKSTDYLLSAAVLATTCEFVQSNEKCLCVLFKSPLHTIREQ